jgi:lipopolysaccharide transport protein LptA
MSSPALQRLFLNVSVMALMFFGVLTGLSLAAARSPAASRPPPEDPDRPTVDARTMDADIKTHVMHLTDVIVTYGKMTVRADRAFATAGDFKNSRWTFDGNVRINADPRGNLRSDEAVVEFEDDQLKRATATGSPAEFDQKREDSDVITHGHAKEIVYEVGAGTVRLSNEAWVSDGKDNMTGPVITYSLKDERVEASTSTTGNERIHVVLSPNEAPKLDNKAEGTNKPKPTTGEAGASDPPASTSPAATGSATTGPAATGTAAPSPAATTPTSPPPGSTQAAPQSAPH